jgi:hypothetical protein
LEETDKETDEEEARWLRWLDTYLPIGLTRCGQCVSIVICNKVSPGATMPNWLHATMWLISWVCSKWVDSTQSNKISLLQVGGKAYWETEAQSPYHWQPESFFPTEMAKLPDYPYTYECSQSIQSTWQNRKRKDKALGTGGVAQVAECLPRKCKVPSTTKKKKKRKKEKDKAFHE